MSVSSLIPRFYKLGLDTSFDDSSVKKNFFSVKPQCGDSAANLNAPGSIAFAYEGQKKCIVLQTLSQASSLKSDS